MTGQNEAEQPPLSPSRTQWSDDGTRWWDGSAWVPRERAAQRQEEVAREQAAAQQAAQQAAWQAQQQAWQDHQAQGPEELFAPPGARPAPPLPPATPVYGEPASPSSTGWALGMWSFGLGLVGASVPAIVLGHLSRARSRRRGLKPFAWSRWGLFLGYTWLTISVGVVALLVWAGLGGIDDKTPAGRSLQVAAEVEQSYHEAYGSYSSAALSPAHFRPADGVTVTVVRADASSYCLKAVERLEAAGSELVLYLSSGTGTVSRTPCL
jgi:hypothetical protein